MTFQKQKKGTQKENVRRVAAFAASVFGIMLFSIMPLHADDLEEKMDELEKLEEKANKYRDIIELEQKEQSVLQSQVGSLENESQRVEKDITKNKEELTTIETDITRIGNAIAEKEAFLETQKKLLAQLLQSHYEHAQGRPLGNFLLADVSSGFLTKEDHLSQTSDKITDVVETTNALRESLIKDRGNLENKKVQVTDLTYQLQQRETYLESAKEQKQVLIAQSESEEANYQRKLTKVEEEQLEIQREIQDIEVGKIEDFSSSDLPSRSKAGFTYPVKKPYRVTQGYGKTSFSKHYDSGIHNGIDFGLAGSSDILAAADGKVVATGDMKKYGYGKWVAIDHGNNLVTLYGHLSSIKTSSGKKVKKGDKIGVMGSTGFSTGTHLHFTVFVKSTFDIVNSKKVSGVKIPVGASVNPMRYL